MPSAVRFIDDSDDTQLGGWLVPFGSHRADGKDSFNTRFGPDTQYGLDWFPNGRPLLWDHGTDTDIDIEPVGHIRALEVKDEGVWMEAQLAKQGRYFDEIRKLVKAGKLYLSSATMAHLMDVDARSGDVLRWPIVEGSLTPTPANLMATIDTHTFRAHVRSAGIELSDDIDAALEGDGDELRKVLDAKAKNALSDSDYAYVDSKGGRHLPINDAAHVRNALARFEQTHFESDSAKTAAKKKILAAAKKFGVDVSGRSAPQTFTYCDDEGNVLCESTIPLNVTVSHSVNPTRANAGTKAVPYERSFEDIRDDISDLLNPPSYGEMESYTSVIATFPAYVIVRSEGDYQKIEYTLDENSEPVLGKVTEMDQVYVPAPSGRSAGLSPLTLDAQTMTRGAAALAQRTKDLSERRLEEGRTLSAAHQRALAETADALTDAAGAVRAALRRADEDASTKAKAAYLASPEARSRQLALIRMKMPASP